MLVFIIANLKFPGTVVFIQVLGRQLNMFVFCFRVMQLALVLVLIILAIFIIVMLMTFVFHVLVFNMRFLVPLTTPEKIDRHQILSKDPYFLSGGNKNSDGGYQV